MVNIDGVSSSRPAITPVRATEETPRPLKAGDQFSAVVVEAENNRDALIRFGQAKAYARLPLPVTSGQEIQVRVLSDGKGGIRLMMVPPEGSAPPFPGQWEIDPFELVSEKSESAFFRSLSVGTTLQARVTGFEKNGQTLMDFGSFKAFATLDGPVHQGQHLTFTVTRMDPTLALRVVDLQSPAQAPAPASVPESSTPAAPLPTGPEISALREAVGTLLRNAATLTSTSVPDSVRSAISTLQTLLTPLPVSDTPEAVVRGLQASIENSGLYFEKKLETLIRNLLTGSTSTASSTPASSSPSAALFQDPAVRTLMEGDLKLNQNLQTGPTSTSTASSAPASSSPSAALSQDPAVRTLMADDLKPSLLILKQFVAAELEGARGPERALLETLKTVVDRSLVSIDHQQQAAVQKPMDTAGFQAFYHLLVLPDARQNARLKVYYAKKGADPENRTPRVSLLLDMDRLGKVRSDLWMVGKDLNVSFFVADENVKTAIEETMLPVKTKLTELFNTVAIHVGVSEKKIEEFDDAPFPETSSRQVDLIV
ncbi:hypothetical protein LJC47_04570 [Desulfosarcina sp. OttesenSCG-928-B08]|nr:hypothetical protein [Desulfosarcina sp. OttesenSCG-928-B08]